MCVFYSICIIYDKVKQRTDNEEFINYKNVSFLIKYEFISKLKLAHIFGHSRLPMYEFFNQNISYKHGIICRGTPSFMLTFFEDNKCSLP